MPDTRPPAASSDLADLLWRVGTGDQAAFRALYDLHASRLYGVAMRITQQPGLAADAMHDAMLQVWRNAGQFDSTRGTPESWLLSLVRYRALDIARTRRREVPGGEMPEPIDDAPGPLDRLETARDAGALHACLAELEEERRRLVLLAFAEGLSHSELASRVGLPLGTVKSWIRRSLAVLRACLDGVR